ncbi:phage major capsid protein [Aureliella helgolandensis]|uniref:Phage capsid family protein n=1 Tax=Aureliella helgolandensis TaxID=2527968 RepID=A0A518G351_9BACT|nr:phage major capsid protein [Aureliella helgolandensis]QDV23031.1 Phage capsid family protein [Aureliella helgolandensis]
MKSVRDLTEQRDELLAVVDGIMARAERENRELSATETQELLDLVGGDGTDGQSGKIGKLNGDIRLAKSVEATRNQKAHGRLESALNEHMGVGATQPLRGGVRMLSRDGKAVDALGQAPIENGIGELARASIVGSRGAHDIIKSAMTTGDNSSGGFMVPEVLMGEIIDAARARSAVLRAGARVMLMPAGDISLARVMRDPEFEVHAELEPITESDIGLGAVVMSAKTVATRIKVSRELAEDAPNFSEMINNTLTRSLAAAVDRFAIHGTGAAWSGLLNNADIGETGSISAVDWLDLSTAFTKIRENNEEPNAAIMSPKVHDHLLSSTIGDGVNAPLGWLNKTPTITSPMIHSTNIPNTHLLVGDWSQLAWGIRSSARIESTTTGGDAFETHAVHVKITTRIDFALLRTGAFYRLKDISL